jgi:hypothetical protein
MVNMVTNKVTAPVGAVTKKFRSLPCGTIVRYLDQIAIVSSLGTKDADSRLVRLSDGDYWTGDMEVEVVPPGTKITIEVAE